MTPYITQMYRCQPPVHSSCRIEIRLAPFIRIFLRTHIIGCSSVYPASEHVHFLRDNTTIPIQNICVVHGFGYLLNSSRDLHHTVPFHLYVSYVSQHIFSQIWNWLPWGPRMSHLCFASKQAIFWELTHLLQKYIVLDSLPCCILSSGLTQSHVLSVLDHTSWFLGISRDSRPCPISSQLLVTTIMGRLPSNNNIIIA